MRALLLALALLVAVPAIAQAQNEDVICWNGRRAARYVKDVNASNRRFHATIAVQPSGAVFVEKRGRPQPGPLPLNANVWRVGYDPGTRTEWVTAVTFPLDGSLENRELEYADLTVTSTAIAGRPIITSSPWGYSSFASDVPGGAVESLPLTRFLEALARPGWVDGTVQLTSTAATRFDSDGLAEDARFALDWYNPDTDERPIRSLTYYLTSADPAPTSLTYANIRQVTMTLYHCPIEDDDF